MKSKNVYWGSFYWAIYYKCTVAQKEALAEMLGKMLGLCKCSIYQRVSCWGSPATY